MRSSIAVRGFVVAGLMVFAAAGWVRAAGEELPEGSGAYGFLSFPFGGVQVEEEDRTLRIGGGFVVGVGVRFGVIPGYLSAIGEAGVGQQKRTVSSGTYSYTMQNGNLKTLNLLLAGHLPYTISPVVLAGVGYQLYDLPSGEMTIYAPGLAGQRQGSIMGHGEIQRSLDENARVYFAGAGVRGRHEEVTAELLYVASFLKFRNADALPMQGAVAVTIGMDF